MYTYIHTYIRTYIHTYIYILCITHKVISVLTFSIYIYTNVYVQLFRIDKILRYLWQDLAWRLSHAATDEERLQLCNKLVDSRML